MRPMATPAPGTFRSQGFLLLVLFSALSLAPCPAGAAYDGPYPYRIGATVGMVGDIAREVAGGRA